MNIFQKTILVLLTIAFKPICPAHIIFDLGGVLVEPNKMAVARKAGIFNLILYALSHMENPRTSLYNILNTLEPFTKSTITTYDENQMPLPGIMCDWLRGIPSKKILDKIEEAMIKNPVLWSLSQAIFEPHNMAKTQRIIQIGQKFVEECIENGHDVYILSNWDPESFSILEKQYPEFFRLFSGIVISGDCGVLKPHPFIYAHLLTEFNLDPKECFFLDNQIENVVAAEALGISGALVKTKKGKPDFNQIRNSLTQWIKEQLQYIA